MINRIFVSVILILIALSANSQSEQEKIQQLETQRQIDKQRKVTVKMDSAIRLSEEGEYEAADEKFKIVLNSLDMWG